MGNFAVENYVPIPSECALTNSKLLESLLPSSLVDFIRTRTLEKYLEHLSEKLPVTINEEGRFCLGEVALPGELLSYVLNQNVRMSPTNCWVENAGMGHIRVAQVFRDILWLLNQPVEMITLGGGTNHFPPLIERLAKAVLALYEQESLRKAVNSNMAPYTVLNHASCRNADQLMLKILLFITLGKQGSQDINALASAKSCAGVDETEEKARKLFKPLKPLISRLLKNYSQENARQLFLHPLFAKLWSLYGENFSNSVATIATDSAALDEGWINKNIRIFIEQMAVLMQSFQKTAETYQAEIILTAGFPAPPASLIAGSLAEQRAESLARNSELTLVMTASGVPQAQQLVFESIAKLALETKGTNLVIQCGYGTLGKELFSYFSNHFSGNDRVSLHWAEKISQAVDFFSALSFSEKPLLLVVKGSEMCRMAVSLGIPMLLTGAVGDHEVGNVLLSCMQSKPNIIILPNVYADLARQIQELFPAESESLLESLSQCKVNSFAEALEKAKDFISQGKQSLSPEVNRGAVLDILNYVIITM